MNKRFHANARGYLHDAQNNKTKKRLSIKTPVITNFCFIRKRNERKKN